MSVMDKFLNAMKLNDEEDGYYDDDFYDDEPEPAKRQTGNAREAAPAEEPVRKQPPKVTPMRQMKKMSAAGMEVCMFKPTNLEGIHTETAQRIIDFASGSCFAIAGNLQKISERIFIITPASVDISGDFQEILSGPFDVSINNGI